MLPIEVFHQVGGHVAGPTVSRGEGLALSHEDTAARARVTGSAAQTLRVTYSVRIERAGELREALSRFGPAGAGIIWQDEESRIRGGAAGPDGSIAGDGPVELTVTADLPAAELSGKTKLSLVLFGGNGDISGTRGVISGTPLVVLDTCTCTAKDGDEKLATWTVPGTHPPVWDPSTDSFDLHPQGPGIPMRLVRNQTDPLWKLICSGADIAQKPVRAEYLRLQINKGHPDYRELITPRTSAALLREIRASVLGTLVESVMRTVPYAGPDTRGAVSPRVSTVGDLVRWAVKTYRLDTVRTPAELAARLREVPAGRDAVRTVWPRLSTDKAAEICRQWTDTSAATMLARMTAHAEESAATDMSALRDMLRSDADELFAQIGWDKTTSLRGAYAFDMMFGLRIHRVLSESGFSARIGGRDGVWRALAVNVLPDIVARRLRGFSAARFYGEPRRNYLRMIWWYIHLSLQHNETGEPDYGATETILMRNSTDTIMQLVDRIGGGYPLELYREIMRQHAERTTGSDVERNLLRGVLERNIELSRKMEPAFYSGGVRKYVQDLFAEALPG